MNAAGKLLTAFTRPRAQPDGAEAHAGTRASTTSRSTVGHAYY